MTFPDQPRPKVTIQNCCAVDQMNDVPFVTTNALLDLLSLVPLVVFSHLDPDRPTVSSDLSSAVSLSVAPRAKMKCARPW